LNGLCVRVFRFRMVFWMNVIAGDLDFFTDVFLGRLTSWLIVAIAVKQNEKRM